MADWTEIPNSNTRDKLTAEHVNALRDNVIALAQRAAGAPVVKTYFDTLDRRDYVRVNNVSGGTGIKTMKVDFNNVFAAHEIPMAYEVIGLDREGDDERSRWRETGQLQSLQRVSQFTVSEADVFFSLYSDGGLLASGDRNITIAIWFWTRIV